MAGITDQAQLMDLALHDTRPAVPLTAARCVTDPALLFQLATTASDDDVVCWAADHLTGDEWLARFATMKHRIFSDLFCEKAMAKIRGHDALVEVAKHGQSVAAQLGAVRKLRHSPAALAEVALSGVDERVAWNAVGLLDDAAALRQVVLAGTKVPLAVRAQAVKSLVSLAGSTGPVAGRELIQPTLEEAFREAVMPGNVRAAVAAYLLAEAGDAVPDDRSRPYLQAMLASDQPAVAERACVKLHGRHALDGCRCRYCPAEMHHWESVPTGEVDRLASSYESGMEYGPYTEVPRYRNQCTKCGRWG